MLHRARTTSPTAGVHASACPCPSSRAFTLIELVLVLVIIAIAVGVALPSLSGFVQSRDLSDSATRFVAAARYARTQAISQAVVYRLNLSPSESRWWLTKADDTGANFVDASTNGQGSFTLSPKLKLACTLPPQENATQYIEFQPGGQVDAATVTISNLTGGSIDIAADSRFDLYHIVPRAGGTR